MTVVRRFIDANRALSRRVALALPHTRPNLSELYDTSVARLANDLAGGTVVDAGGGRSCSFAPLLAENRPYRLIAVDLSAQELALNRDVDETRVADIGRALPFERGEVDLLVSKTVLEHVTEPDRFFAEAGRVVKSGGRTVHLLPCRYAPFAVIARVLPFSLAKSILHFVNPYSAGVVEFPVFYNRCTAHQLRELLAKNGFREIRTVVGYYQSDYFEAFFPAFILSVAYELVVRALGLSTLGAYVVVSAVR